MRHCPLLKSQCPLLMYNVQQMLLTVVAFAYPHCVIYIRQIVDVITLNV